MEYALKVTELTKIIQKHTILDKVNLAVPVGASIGIVGRNGSGKSMLFKAVCGLILPTSGSIEVWGKKVGTNGKFPQDTGILIESPGFLPQYSGYGNLSMLASIQNKIKRPEIEAAIVQVGLDPTDKRPIRKYSMGMKQRLGIAQALMEKPRLLILDEPMNGLDAKGVIDMRNILQHLREQNGITLILTSHHKDDIDALCDTVYDMDNGVLTPSIA